MMNGFMTSVQDTAEVTRSNISLALFGGSGGQSSGLTQDFIDIRLYDSTFGV